MSIVSLDNVVFQPDQFIPLNTVAPSDAYVPGGPISVPDPGFPASEQDLGSMDTFTVTNVDLSTANSYRLGTCLIQDTGPGGPVGGPAPFDILGANANQVILGNPPFNPTPSPGLPYYGQYTVVSLTNINNPTYPLQFTFDPNAYAPCFARGTRIATRSGEVAVETIRVGDEVRTMSGEFRPVVWVGHRFVDLSRHANPDLVRPIRILAGALAENVPSRDLVVSPDHNLFLEGVLIPAKCLINRTTIAIHDVTSVTYHHIELDSHDIVLAEGAATETYLDTGNRTAFAGQDVTEAHPDFSTAPDVNYFAWDAKGCARLVITGPEVERARAAVMDRAGATAVETALVA